MKIPSLSEIKKKYGVVATDSHGNTITDEWGEEQYVCFHYDEIDNRPFNLTADGYKDMASSNIRSKILTDGKLSVKNQITEEPWAHFTYEEIINMHNDGTNVPSDVLKQAYALMNEASQNDGTNSTQTDLYSTATNNNLNTTNSGEDPYLTFKKNAYNAMINCDSKTKKVEETMEDNDLIESELTQIQKETENKEKEALNKIQNATNQEQQIKTKLNNGKKLTSTDKTTLEDSNFAIKELTQNLKQTLNLNANTTQEISIDLINKNKVITDSNKAGEQAVEISKSLQTFNYNPTTIQGNTQNVLGSKWSNYSASNITEAFSTLQTKLQSQAYKSEIFAQEKKSDILNTAQLSNIDISLNVIGGDVSSLDKAALSIQATSNNSININDKNKQPQIPVTDITSITNKDTDNKIPNNNSKSTEISAKKTSETQVINQNNTNNILNNQIKTPQETDKNNKIPQNITQNNSQPNPMSTNIVQPNNVKTDNIKINNTTQKISENKKQTETTSQKNTQQTKNITLDESQIKKQSDNSQKIISNNQTDTNKFTDKINNSISQINGFQTELKLSQSDTEVSTNNSVKIKNLQTNIDSKISEISNSVSGINKTDIQSNTVQDTSNNTTAKYIQNQQKTKSEIQNNQPVTANKTQQKNKQIISTIPQKNLETAISASEKALTTGNSVTKSPNKTQSKDLMKINSSSQAKIKQAQNTKTESKKLTKINDEKIAQKQSNKVTEETAKQAFETVSVEISKEAENTAIKEYTQETFSNEKGRIQSSVSESEALKQSLAAITPTSIIKNTSSEKVKELASDNKLTTSMLSQVTQSAGALIKDETKAEDTKKLKSFYNMSTEAKELVEKKKRRVNATDGSANVR